MKRLFILPLLILVLTGSLRSQSAERTYFGVYIGGGWLHYFNNMEIELGVPVDIQNDHACFSGKIMWEPGRRLSVGLESGYYPMYKYSESDNSEHSAASNFVPILMNISMRVVDNFSVGLGTGMVILNNHIEGVSNADSRVMSMSNFHIMASYNYPLSRNWTVGGEARYMWIGKTNDYNMSIQALLGFRF